LRRVIIANAISKFLKHSTRTKHQLIRECQVVRLQCFPTFLASRHFYSVGGRQGGAKKFLNLADTIYMKE